MKAMIFIFFDKTNMSDVSADHLLETNALHITVSKCIQFGGTQYSYVGREALSYVIRVLNGTRQPASALTH